MKTTLSPSPSNAIPISALFFRIRFEIFFENSDPQLRFIFLPLGELLIIICSFPLNIFGAIKDVPPLAQSISNLIPSKLNLFL